MASWAILSFREVDAATAREVATRSANCIKKS
jgi:hypothetical protein